MKSELSGKNRSVTFNGTTRLGEVFVIVVHFVGPNWCIYQKLDLLPKRIMRSFVNTMSVEYGVTSEQILAVMHDCALTNTVAMYTIRVMYSMALDIGCFSHTLDRVGERFDLPTLHSSMVYWIDVFSHSSKAKSLI